MCTKVTLAASVVTFMITTIQFVMQAKAALQASASAETKSQLAAVAQQQRDINKAMQGHHQHAKAARQTVEDLQHQKEQAQSELDGLLSQIPELSGMMNRYVFCQMDESAIVSSITTSAVLQQCCLSLYVCLWVTS